MGSELAHDVVSVGFYRVNTDFVDKPLRKGGLRNDRRRYQQKSQKPSHHAQAHNLRMSAPTKVPTLFGMIACKNSSHGSQSHRLLPLVWELTLLNYVDRPVV